MAMMTHLQHFQTMDLLRSIAPGVDVLSTYKGSAYAKMSGTSMAAPNVAGAATLVKSINPSATPEEVEVFLKEELHKPANPLVGHSVCNSDGKGYFDSTNDDDNEREGLLIYEVEKITKRKYDVYHPIFF